MSKVFVVQDTPGKNLFPAKKFGEIVIILPEGNYTLTPEIAVEKISRVLKPFSSDDYLLLIGDPVLIGISMAVAMRICGKVRVLKWDKQAHDYWTVTVEL